MSEYVDFDKYITISVDKMVKASWNYKHEDDFLKRKLFNNIKKNGQIENIIVRELDDGTYEVVNGNHRYDVLKEVGETEIYAYNLGRISDALAYRIAIETNETKFDCDVMKLAETVDEIIEEFGKTDAMSTLPYDEDQIDDFIMRNLGDNNIDMGEIVEDPKLGDNNDLEVGDEFDTTTVKLGLTEVVRLKVIDLINTCNTFPIGKTNTERVSKVFGILVEKMESISDEEFTYDTVVNLFEDLEVENEDFLIESHDSILEEIEEDDSIDSLVDLDDVFE